MTSGVILYGPPASGKDTITAALHDLDPRYQHFPRLKYGPGRTTGYRMVDAGQLTALRSKPGEIIYENSRYGAVYVIDRTHLLDMARAGLVPVIHLGQPNGVDAVTALAGVRWTVVELCCPRPVAAARIAARNTEDTAERLTAYDATPRLAAPDLCIDTGRTQPHDAAALISSHM